MCGKNLLFGFSALSHDFSLSIVHAFAVFFLVLFALAKEEQELWTMSLTTYSAVVVVVTIRIAVGTRTWTLANVIAYIGSLGLFIFWLYFYDRISADPTIRGVAPPARSLRIQSEQQAREQPGTALLVE